MEIQENTRVGTCYFDGELRYQEINEFLASLNGVSPSEHIGRTLDEIIPGETDDLAAQLRQVIDTGEPITKGLAYVETAAHPGIKRLYQHDFYPNKSKDGNVSGVRCVVHAITDLHVDLEEIEHLIERLEAENIYLRHELRQAGHHEELIGESSAMRRVSTLISQVAPTDAAVLILGETGTGKELVAHAVHAQSCRADHDIVKLNCATLPAALIESELFGHARGAFTGAITERVGRFELADGGTIFLDEIGDLPLELQPKLLRVLQSGEFEPLGSTKTIRVDVRVVAATNHDLEQAVADGRFREDLFFRLAVFPIRVPPLRERSGDIPILVRHFLNRSKASMGKRIESVPDDVMQRLSAYSWRGNVRELENVIERAVILTRGTSLQLDGAFGQERRSSATPIRLEDVERAHILRVLEECDWRIKGDGNAAVRLGLHPSTLTNKLKKLGIGRPSTSKAVGN